MHHAKITGRQMSRLERRRTNFCCPLSGKGIIGGNLLRETGGSGQVMTRKSVDVFSNFLKNKLIPEWFHSCRFSNLRGPKITAWQVDRAPPTGKKSRCMTRSFDGWMDGLIDWLQSHCVDDIDWLIDWLVGSMIDQDMKLFDWLIGWLKIRLEQHGYLRDKVLTSLRQRLTKSTATMNETMKEKSSWIPWERPLLHIYTASVWYDDNLALALPGALTCDFVLFQGSLRCRHGTRHIYASRPCGIHLFMRGTETTGFPSTLPDPDRLNLQKEKRYPLYSRPDMATSYNQSINRWINKSNNQSINQSINGSINQTIDIKQKRKSTTNLR